MSVIAGVFFHAVGATGASVCYTPQKKTIGWSWQTYWLAQGAVCWLLMPLLIAFLTIPQLGDVLSEAPSSSMWTTFLLGAAYGVGGTAFGIAIRYVGFSLTYAISVGISCVVGTLLPPLVSGKLTEIMSRDGATMVISGIIIGALGIALCGVAGRKKEIDIVNESNARSFSLSKGLPICIFAGILSAVYGFSLDQGQPIADIAFRHGAGQFQGNVIYIFSNTGAFVTTASYCIYLHVKEGTFHEYTSGTSRFINYSMATITGVLWYSQFFFYGLGHVRMGEYKFSSWAIHMIMLVLFSSMVGLLLKEWASTRPYTRRILASALATLIVAVLIISYGNYVGEHA